jgi:RimJ/RimL family protein N-acetyltransferase
MTAPAIVLRQWQDQDLDPYAAMNADPVVMEFFPKPLTREESAASLTRQRAGIAGRGWGFWAVEVDGVFAGFTGLAEPRFTAPFTPCVEIGWRLRREFWGRGIAFAAATSAVAFAFNQLRLPELVSFTAALNLRSRRLMERLEFVRRDSADFLHPLLDPASPLCRHVLYRRPRPVAAPSVSSAAVIVP